jgi:hypothetical protein
MPIDRPCYKAPRKLKSTAPEPAENVDETDLSSLKAMVAQLDDIWEFQVMAYSSRLVDTGACEDYFVARVHFKLVSALAAFDAEYVRAKASIERRFELALRMSGVSKAELERIASVLPQ